MEKNNKAVNILYKLLSNPPPDVDLTLVGGGALILWINFYRKHYPENFDTLRLAGTKDIDFITLKEDVYKCYKHWGGKLSVPDIDHATPEIAILCINPESENTVEIDFLQDLIGISRTESLKEREPILGFSDRGCIYFLNEIMVLMNRVMNTLSLSKYQNTHAYDQIFNAMAVVKSAIMAKFDTDDHKGATRLAHKALKMAHSRKIGINLYVNFGIDLLNAVPVPSNNLNYTEQFTTIAQPKFLHEIHERRKSTIKHLKKRGQQAQKWW